MSDLFPLDIWSCLWARVEDKAVLSATYKKAIRSTPLSSCPKKTGGENLNYVFVFVREFTWKYGQSAMEKNESSGHTGYENFV